MEKSYSDFAKELGVSKQKLNYYVNDENKEKIFIKKGNKNYVTEFGQEYLYKIVIIVMWYTRDQISAADVLARASGDLGTIGAR